MPDAEQLNQRKTTANHKQIGRAYGGNETGPQPHDRSLSTRDEIARAVEAIRLCSQYAIERANMLPEGVRLAAEQVQDIRIELLEKGPQVTTADALLPVLITFCLESTIAGASLTIATKAIFAPLLDLQIRQQAAPYTSLLERYRGSGLVIQQLLALGPPDPSAIRNRFERVAEAVGGFGVAAIKAASARQTVPEGPDAGDTPAVSIQEAALEYASEQRLWITALYAQLEARLLSGHLTQVDLEKATRFDPLKDFTALKRSYKRFFEAVIWAALFKFGQRNGSYVGTWGRAGPTPGSSRRVSLFVGPPGLFGIRDPGPQNLLQYWAERLLDPSSDGQRTFAQGEHPWEVLESLFGHKLAKRNYSYEESEKPAMLAAGNYLGEIGKRLAKVGPKVLIAQTVQPEARVR